MDSAFATPALLFAMRVSLGLLVVEVMISVRAVELQLSDPEDADDSPRSAR